MENLKYEMPETAKTLKEIYPIWAEDHMRYVKESTMSAYHLVIRHRILPVWGKLTAVTKDIAEAQIIAWTSSGLSVKTIRDTILTANMLLEFAFDQGWQPYCKIKARFPADTERKTRELQRYDSAEIKKLIAYCESKFNNRNLGILIVCFTGLRIGEICGLQFKDIDIPSKVINIRCSCERIYDVEKRKTKIIFSTPKTKNSCRSVPICARLMSILKPIMKVSSPEFFVLSNEDSPIEPRTYRNYFSTVTEKVGLPRLNFHGLRHSFASMMVESKVDIKTVSSILGHSDITTTLNLYCHPTGDNKRSAIDKVFRL